MKKLFIAILVLALAVPVMALADPSAPKAAGAHPDINCNTGDVVMPRLPNGTLNNVRVFNDVDGIPGQDIGAQHNFRINPATQSFNFWWTDKQGNLWWQMVTPQSPNAVYHSAGYKYGCKSKLPK